MIDFSEFVERKDQEALIKLVAKQLVDLGIEPEGFVQEYTEGMFGDAMKNAGGRLAALGQKVAGSKAGQWTQGQVNYWNDPARNIDDAERALVKLAKSAGKKFIQGGTVNDHLRAIMNQLMGIKNGLAPQQSQQGQFDFMNPEEPTSASTPSGSASGPAPSGPPTNNPNRNQGSLAFN